MRMRTMWIIWYDLHSHWILTRMNLSGKFLDSALHQHHLNPNWVSISWKNSSLRVDFQRRVESMPKSTDAVLATYDGSRGISSNLSPICVLAAAPSWYIWDHQSRSISNICCSATELVCIFCVSLLFCPFPSVCMYQYPTDVINSPTISHRLSLFSLLISFKNRLWIILCSLAGR